MCDQITINGVNNSSICMPVYILLTIIYIEITNVNEAYFARTIAKIMRGIFISKFLQSTITSYDNKNVCEYFLSKKHLNLE